MRASGATSDQLVTTGHGGVVQIINGKRGVTAEMALRLSRVFDNSPEFSMNLQNAVDLYDAREAMVRAAAR